MKKQKAFKERIVFHTDTFVDYQGVSREFTICAIVNEINRNVVAIDGEYILYHTPENLGKFQIDLGIAIRNTDDAYKPELGETIAEGKARKKIIDSFIVERKFQTKKSLIENILKAYGEEFKKDPSIYIAGYKKMAEKWYASQKNQAERA